jgi:hypothetical protein
MGSKTTLPVSLALVALAQTGCIAHVSRGAEPPETYRYQPPQASHPAFDYRGGAVIELTPAADGSRYHDTFELTFAASGGHGGTRVEGLYLRSRSPGAKKLVVVLPIWGTSEYPPSRIAHGYARRSRGDAHVIWIFGQTPLFPWTSLSSTASVEQFRAMARESALRYRDSVIDLRRLLDWTDTRPEIDPDRIAMVGFSMSALVTATLLANDARITTAVLVMGAARFADIFAYCDNRAGDVRDHVLQAYGWSLEEYRGFFGELFDPADPVHYRGRYDPDRILMVDAAFDDCMPRAARDALWEATGRPTRISLLSWHRGAFYSMTPLGLNFLRGSIYRFLDRAL